MRCTISCNTICTCSLGSTRRSTFSTHWLSAVSCSHMTFRMLGSQYLVAIFCSSCSAANSLGKRWLNICTSRSGLLPCFSLCSFTHMSSCGKALATAMRTPSCVRKSTSGAITLTVSWMNGKKCSPSSAAYVNRILHATDLSSRADVRMARILSDMNGTVSQSSSISSSLSKICTSGFAFAASNRGGSTCGRNGRKSSPRHLQMRAPAWNMMVLSVSSLMLACARKNSSVTSRASFRNMSLPTATPIKEMVSNAFPRRVLYLGSVVSTICFRRGMKPS
mmetsp:Transcript_46623/g.117425  ORF Transcript_46623/g.117425 Transcript_46623/m.117425 type:complete len:278 (+) Transcript_46623:2691-3524(+)